ncbi:NPCBM/NEW2 domain-containing protein [Paenibacillus sp. LjRoot153]|uniref:NPCBM/NEW2 domain-containing protein n=1 Tax=Paenibacillus sp. LjRoot153 TaxID=3342270 RepID=UPI003ED0B3BB
MKKIVISALFISTLGLGVGVGGYAAANIEQIQAFLNHEIKFTLNGKSWSPKDPDGKAISPIIYEGSSYVPLRAVGEAAGLLVDWDQVSQTIILQSSTAGVSTPEGVPYKDAKDYTSTPKPTPTPTQVPPSTPKPTPPPVNTAPTQANDLETTYSTFNVHTNTKTAEYKAEMEEAAREGAVYLTELPYLKIVGSNVLKRVRIDASSVDSDVYPLQREGKLYAHGIGAKLDGQHPRQSITYDLGGTYKTFAFNYTFDDKNSNFNRPAKITVYGDGRLLATKTDFLVSNGKLPYEIMDISGVKQLQIDFELILNEGKENGYVSVLAIYKPKLFKS